MCCECAIPAVSSLKLTKNRTSKLSGVEARASFTTVTLPCRSSVRGRPGSPAMNVTLPFAKLRISMGFHLFPYLWKRAAVVGIGCRANFDAAMLPQRDAPGKRRAA